MDDKKWKYEIISKFSDDSPFEDKLCDYCNGFAVYLVRIYNNENSFYRCLCKKCYEEGNAE